MPEGTEVREDTFQGLPVRECEEKAMMMHDPHEYVHNGKRYWCPAR